MNDLKFRVWNYYDKEMFNSDDAYNLEHFFSNHPFDHSDVMQFAQCTDDKGVDIYAGDILAATDYCDGDVIYFEVRFCRGGYGNILGFYFYEAGGKDGRSIPNMEFNLKVVGNIYENKELLGDTE